MPEQVDRLFTFIAALVVKDESEDTRCAPDQHFLNGFRVLFGAHARPPSPPDAEEIAEEQNKIAAIVHLIQSDNTDVLMKM
jgi:hypothetical protein